MGDDLPSISGEKRTEPRATASDERPSLGEEADRELARLAKAISHPARIRILRLLARDPGCMCGALFDQMPLAQSTVSQHLKVLKEAGLIQGEIDRPRICYCTTTATLRRLKQLVSTL